MAAPSVDITQTKSDSFTVTWSELPCGSRSGSITMYKYQLQHNNALVTAGQTGNMTLAFSDLMPCGEYMFGVSAVNVAGMRGPSTDLIITTGRIIG